MIHHNPPAAPDPALLDTPEVERLKAALRRMIDDDCWYADGCAGDKRCHPCEARHALGVPYDEQKFEKLRWERHERRQSAQEEDQ